MYIKGDMVKCNKCGTMYMEGPFINITTEGERSTSTIEIYGEFYDLCPKCTNKLYEFINKKEEK